jgi:(E)-4-hydroxy-3-methylbut-2-enyl-diphosphate synthase
MGCVVNGPGESRDADIGVSSGNGKGQIFVHGEVVATVPEHKIVDALIDEATKLAAQETRSRPHPMSPTSGTPTTNAEPADDTHA